MDATRTLRTRISRQMCHCIHIARPGAEDGILLEGSRARLSLPGDCCRVARSGENQFVRR